MSKTCLFCGTTGPGSLTNEHVNPLWLLHHLGLPDDDQLFQGVASSETGELVGPPRVHSSFSFVQGRVCDQCNSGWMSRLEGATKPILCGLIDQERAIDSLTEPETLLIGRWAAKTAYLHASTSPLKCPVPVQHLQTLCGDGGVVAPKVAVFAMQGPYVQPTAYYQTGCWPHIGGQATGQAASTAPEAYKVGLQFRALYLLVAFWPDPMSSLIPHKDMHLQLLPLGPGDAWYRVPIHVGSGRIDRLAAFANSLAVWYPQLAV